MSLFSGSLQKYGQIDILVSNAAANLSIDPIVSMSEKALDKLWEINVKASIQIVQVNWNVY
jgi:dehydrogenase/reductase SDR family protein 4